MKRFSRRESIMSMFLKKLKSGCWSIIVFFILFLVYFWGRSYFPDSGRERFFRKIESRMENKWFFVSPMRELTDFPWVYVHLQHRYIGPHLIHFIHSGGDRTSFAFSDRRIHLSAPYGYNSASIRIFNREECFLFFRSNWHERAYYIMHIDPGAYRFLSVIDSALNDGREARFKALELFNLVDRPFTKIIINQYGNRIEITYKTNASNDGSDVLVFTIPVMVLQIAPIPLRFTEFQGSIEILPDNEIFIESIFSEPGMEKLNHPKIFLSLSGSSSKEE